MAETVERVPPHLRRFVVEQDYLAYTAVDHAVWRFVLLQMYDRLQRTAHPAYARGLSQTGMSVERIPRIADMDRCLSAFGWGAVCVDGFIPPRAFVDFQACGILPIAAEIRRVEHLPYTPAPDIIHEAGGHAPILPDAQYAGFLRRIGAYGTRAFASGRDARIYEAIRKLSVVKEDRDATPSDIGAAQRALAELVAQPEAPSEAAQLARLYWWTAEYGLVGTPQDYRLYGAGLLSSLAESHFCHDPTVRKLPLTRECTAVDYDITRPQPQLFVVRELAELGEVLDDVCANFAFRQGGLAGLETARDAHEVATIELDSGFSLTAEVAEVVAEEATPELVVMRGGCALGHAGRILDDHARQAYPADAALAWGELPSGQQLASLTRESMLRRFGAAAGERVRVDCARGLRIEGRLEDTVEREAARAFVLQGARVSRGGHVLWSAEPESKLIVASGAVESVRAGAADATYWPTAQYSGCKAPARNPEDTELRARRVLYERAATRSPRELGAVFERLHEHPDEWLLRFNLLEAFAELGIEPERRARLASELWQLEKRFEQRDPIAMGLRYLGYEEEGGAAK